MKKTSSTRCSKLCFKPLKRFCFHDYTINTSINRGVNGKATFIINCFNSFQFISFSFEQWVSSIFFIIIFSFCLSTKVLSQSRAKAQENVKAITDLMKTCVNHDWMLYDILFNGKPFMNYNVLFNENVSKKIDTSVLDKRDQYFKGEFGLDPRSELSKKLIDPLDKEFIRMSSENPEPNDSMNAISKKEREISVVYVYVFINKKKIEGRPFTGEKIPGVSLATMLNGAYRDSCNWDSYFLAFGNWKSSVGRSDSEIHKFRFKHNANSHDIENLVVVLTGVKSRVDELLTKINWQQLNKLISN